MDFMRLNYTDDRAVALPSDVNDILGLIRLVSHWMFGLFLVGACLTFIMIFLAPLAVYSRWASLPLVILSFVDALFVTAAAIIATVMVSLDFTYARSDRSDCSPFQFIIMQDAVTKVEQLNIEASIGIEMFVFMWIAAGTAILAWIIQLSLCCCCASRRDVRKGKKRGSMKAWRESSNTDHEKPPPRYSGDWDE